MKGIKPGLILFLIIDMALAIAAILIIANKG